MKLIKIKISNYRCFGEDEQIIPIDDITSFIGNNSTGKTAALLALNCIFSNNVGDRILRRSDFHLPKDKNPEDLVSQTMHIEAVFTFDGLDQKEGDPAIPIYFQNAVVVAPNATPILRIRLEAIWEKSSNMEGAIDSKVYFITCPEEEEIKDEYKRPASRKDLDCIRVIYIPAVRDPSKQLKNASGTMMNQIMSSINWNSEVLNDVKAKIEELNSKFLEEKGVSILDSSIGVQWKKYDSDSRYSQAKLRFNSVDMDSSIKKTEVTFSPTVTGRECSIDEMSDGLRSLFYISLVDSILDVESTIQNRQSPDSCPFNFIPPALTIIALEEPENHIAPHLIGKLVINLERIAKKKNSQIVLTSHSTAVIRRFDPEKIRYFRLDEKYTTKVSIIPLPDKEKKPEQYKYIKEAVKAYPELYFAKLVILGEGDSEEIILPRIWNAKSEDIDISGISVVPLGGRHVNHFWRLLNDLHIPHITILDLDLEREGGGWGRIKYVLDQLIINDADKNVLLKIDDKILSDTDLKKMHNRDNDMQALEIWVSKLEQYNVFFSKPLDIDFLMLESYPDVYKGIVGENEGPRLNLVDVKGEKKQKHIAEIEALATPCAEYNNRINDDVRHTLKKCGGNGELYSDEQKKLMVWYTYFFLNRGKPSTHVEALSQIDNAQLMKNIPKVLNRLINTAEKMLKGMA